MMGDSTTFDAFESHLAFVPRRQEVPVPVRCKADFPKPPPFALDGSTLRNKTLFDTKVPALVEIEQRRAREENLEAVLKAYAGPPAS